MSMKRLDWLDLWDTLRAELANGNTTWGRNQILELMGRLEREKVRELERETVERIEEMLTASADEGEAQ